MAETKLLPCPFCPANAAQVVCDDPQNFYVCCSKHYGGCGASSGYYRTEQEAVDKWNRRVPPTEEQIVAYIEETMAENREMLAKMKKKHGFE